MSQTWVNEIVGQSASVGDESLIVHESQLWNIPPFEDLTWALVRVGCRAAPFPAAVLFNGYGVTSDHYRSIANRLASWGYAVIQVEPSQCVLRPKTNDAQCWQICTSSAFCLFLCQWNFLFTHWLLYPGTPSRKTCICLRHIIMYAPAIHPSLFIISPFKQGCVCFQYDRSDTTPPSNDVELTYFDAIIKWRTAVNGSVDSQYGGKFAPESVVVGTE